MNPLLVLKGRQLQAGADWDSVITITTGILLFVCVAVLLALVISRLMQRQRMRAHRRHRRH